MPRPKKWRNVCCLPVNNRFGPINSIINEANIIKMSVEEYETIRLIDLEGMKQEECALRMEIARTTVQGIYDDARKKVADSIVNGKVLYIEGGNYKLCEDFTNNCSRMGCNRNRNGMNNRMNRL